MTKRVFISFSGLYLEYARQLATDLEQCARASGADLSCFVANDRTDAGNSIPDRLRLELGRSDALVLLHTPEAWASDWCRTEIDTALMNELQLLVVKLTPWCPVPAMERHTRWLEVQPGPEEKLSYGRAIEQLCRSLTGKSPEALDLVPPPRPVELTGEMRDTVLTAMARVLHKSVTHRRLFAVDQQWLRGRLDANEPKLNAAIVAALLRSPKEHPKRALARAAQAVIDSFEDDLLVAVEVAQLKAQLPDLKEEQSPEGLAPLVKRYLDYLRSLCQSEYVELRFRATHGEVLRASEMVERWPASLYEDLCHLVVFDVGTGKTAFLREVERQMLDELAEREGDRVPVYLRLPDVMGPSKQLSLLRRACELEAQAEFDADALHAELKQLADRGRLALLADGLDELSKENREAASKSLIRFASAHPGCLVIAASRPHSAELLSCFTNWQTTELDPTEQLELAQRLDVDAVRLLEIAAERQQLAPLTTRPLLLKWLLQTLASSPTTSRVGTVYGSILDEILKQSHRPNVQHTEILDVHQARDVLQRLATHLTHTNDDDFLLGELDELLYDEAPLHEPIWGVTDWNSAGVKEEVELIERTTGVLKRAPDGQELRFAYRFFRELLAAEFIKRASTEHRRCILVHEDFDSVAWREPLALAGELLRSPDGLLRAVEEHQPDLLVEVAARVHHWRDLHPLVSAWRRAAGSEQRRALCFGISNANFHGHKIRLSRDLDMNDVTPEGLYFLARALDANRALQEDGSAAVDVWHAAKEKTPPTIPEWIDSGDVKIAARPVSVEEFRRFFPKLKQPPWSTDAHPVVDVSWFDAMGYCRFLTHTSGLHGRIRLPTPEEWRRVSAWPALTVNEQDSAGSEEELEKRKLAERTAFLDDASWFAHNRNADHHPSHPRPIGEGGEWPSGGFDLLGNVHEWTDQEAGKPFAPSISEKILGGSWESGLKDLLERIELERPRSYRDTTTGFRLVWQSDG